MINSLPTEREKDVDESTSPSPPASYIAIVYSWIDIKNFKYAGITLLNNQTYSFFTTVRDAETYMANGTEWPGTKIDLDIKPGDLVRMALLLRDNSEVLNVNGIEVNNNSVENNINSYAGLFYSRVEDVLFHNFDLKPSIT
jgi:hypothetical protein